MRDVAVVGAGINGALCAYRLHKAGYDVCVFDSRGAAGGGSGAAGAFLSPKFLKSGEIKTLVNTALNEAFDFYGEEFPSFFERHPLLHIARDERDARNIRICKEEDDFKLCDSPAPFTPEAEHAFICNSAIVDAAGLIRSVTQQVAFKDEEILTLSKQEQGWLLNGRYAFRRVILATGAYGELSKEPYLQGVIRGIWGHRIDVTCTFENPVSIHRFVSLSPSHEGVLSIGATHDVSYDPGSGVAYDVEAGRAELLQKARLSIGRELEGVTVVRDYTGLRSGSSDYLPLVGELVDAQTTLSTVPMKSLSRKKPDYERFLYHEGLYMINGSAGYGFVLAPFLSRVLCEHIVRGAAVPKALQPARFFSRYVRRKLL